MEYMQNFAMEYSGNRLFTRKVRSRYIILRWILGKLMMKLYVDGSGSGSRFTTNLDVSSDGHSGLISNKYDYMQLLIPVLIRHDVQNFGEIVINVTGSVLDSRCSVLDLLDLEFF